MVDEEYQSADDQSVSSTESGETHDERMATRENYEQEQEKQEALRNPDIYSREVPDLAQLWWSRLPHIGQGRIWEIHFDEVSCHVFSGQERIRKLGWGSTLEFCSILLLGFRRSGTDVSRGPVLKSAV